MPNMLKTESKVLVLRLGGLSGVLSLNFANSSVNLYLTVNVGTTNPMRTMLCA